jgi:hypothetical protein
MSAATEQLGDTYQHRACLACGKRIPRWTKTGATPASKRFCNASCGSFHRRTHQGPHVTEKAKKPLAAQRLLKPVCATEDAPEHAPCRACGRSCRIRPGEPTYCNETCQAYTPSSARKPNGEWFIVAGPVDYCAGCGLAIIGPAWRRDDKAYCSASCRQPAKPMKAPRRSALAQQKIADLQCYSEGVA